MPQNDRLMRFVMPQKNKAIYWIVIINIIAICLAVLGITSFESYRSEWSAFFNAVWVYTVLFWTAFALYSLIKFFIRLGNRLLRP